MRRKDFVDFFIRPQYCSMFKYTYINALLAVKVSFFSGKMTHESKEANNPFLPFPGPNWDRFFSSLRSRESVFSLSLLLLCRRDGGGETLTHILFRALLFPRPLCGFSLPFTLPFFGTQVSPSHTTKLNSSESDDRTFP